MANWVNEQFDEAGAKIRQDKREATDKINAKETASAEKIKAKEAEAMKKIKHNTETVDIGIEEQKRAVE